jgi:hypothetical protein
MALVSKLFCTNGQWPRCRPRLRLGPQSLGLSTKRLTSTLNDIKSTFLSSFYDTKHECFLHDYEVNNKIYLCFVSDRKIIDLEEPHTRKKLHCFFVKFAATTDVHICTRVTF